MAYAASASLARHLGSLFDGGSAAGLSDRQLLERFNAGRDEAAFAAIVSRHGPMVLGVCRQLLGDHQHAEDAFQAVFLVLARRAPTLRDPDLLGNWLYGVALRTASKARTRLARRRRAEGRGAGIRPEARPVLPAEQAAAREQAEALHREIDRLPRAFRTPIVLCYLEGLSPDEAAARLRCPGGTLRSRLVRARERLRRGLVRRGVVLSGPALAAMLAPRPAEASVPPLLCDSTARAAIAFAARNAVGGIPAEALARAVLHTLIRRQMRAATLNLLLFAAIAVGVGYHALSAFAGPREGESPGEPRAQRKARTETHPPDSPRPAPGRMFVVGRVLDPSGRPVAGAKAMAYATVKWPGRGDRLAPMWPSAIGRALSDRSGRFRLEAPRISSSRHYEFGALAIAPGYGVGWVELDPDADQPVAEIMLRPEQVIEGRVLDIQGQPVPGVSIAVDRMSRAAPQAAAIPEQPGPFFLPGQPEEPPAWPRPATSDADGRFTIRGVGRDVEVGLVVQHPRFARQSVKVATDGPSKTRSMAIAVEPARIFNGRVTYADTGRPVPHAAITISTLSDGGSAWAGDFETDDQGRFRANPGAGGRYNLSVGPPEREPYLNVSKIIEWPKGAVEHPVDLALSRGVLVRGRVVEEGSDRPVAGARIGYLSHPDRDPRTGAWNSRATTVADGSFAFGVMPAPGYLTVLGAGEDYVLQELGQRLALAGQPGGRRLYAHAFHKLDLKPEDIDREPGDEVPEIRIALRKSAPVSGRVVDPDGRPLKEATIISRVVLQPTWGAFLRWSHFYRGAVRDGHFAVHGLADDAEAPAFFLDAKHNLGATMRLSGRSGSDGPVTVRLAPCGSARARLIDPEGKPVVRYIARRLIAMIITPGRTPEHDRAGPLDADQAAYASIVPEIYDAIASDADGRVTLPALIPGATYCVSAPRQQGGFSFHRDIIVRPGETIDLGEIVIEKPRS